MTLRPVQRTVIVFFKAPRLGRVKSRLARDLGRVRAWSFYRRQSAGLVRRLATDRRWRLLLAVSPDGWRDPAAWPAGVACVDQGRGDLGRRMLSALRMAGPGPAVLVGSDIPLLAPSHLWRAFRLLGRHDVVFGPAEDGGFWLVGASHANRMPDLFAGVRWSSPNALADTQANIRPGLSHALADLLWDVDTIADLERLNAPDGVLRRRWR